VNRWDLSEKKNKPEGGFRGARGERIVEREIFKRERGHRNFGMVELAIRGDLGGQGGKKKGKKRRVSQGERGARGG